MAHRRNLSWLRLLCAFALGIGLLAATSATAAGSSQPGPAVAQAQSVVHHAVTTAARAPRSFGHHLGRHLPSTMGSALLAAAVLVGVLAVAAWRRAASTTRGGRRTASCGARAPPVVIGI